MVDRDGNMPSLPNGVVDFGAGLGDVLTFGITRRIRELGDIGSVDACSSAYGAGEVAGVVANIATGFIGGTKAVAKASSGAAVNWQNFSHSLIPNNVLKRIDNPVAKWFNKTGNRLNGDHVTPLAHLRMDVGPYKFLKVAEKEAVQLFSSPRRALNRIPYTPGAAGYAAGSAGLNHSSASCD